MFQLGQARWSALPSKQTTCKPAANHGEELLLCVCVCVQESHADDLPAAYGTSTDSLGSPALAASAPPAQQHHNPLAPNTAADDSPPQQHSWQHYPDPAPTAPPAAAPNTAFAGAQQQAGSNGHYPHVPAPADYNISLGSAGSVGSGSLAGSAQATPCAVNAATLGLATAISTMPTSNPELGIVVLNPLR